MRSKKSAARFSAYARLLCIALLLALGACHSFTNRMWPADKEALPRRTAAASARQEKLEVPRAAYKSALTQAGSANAFRLVRIYSGAKEGESEGPQWRLFDVRKGSVCEMLGLKTGDVILAANDHLFTDATKFAAYLTLLADEKQASIQVRREAQEYLFSYMFVDPDGAPNIP